MQDLGHLLPANPLTPSSMMAGNSVTQDGTGYAAPGSPSEAVKAEDIGQIPALADMAVTSNTRPVVA